MVFNKSTNNKLEILLEQRIHQTPPRRMDAIIALIMAKTLVRPDNNSTCPTVHADPQTYAESYFTAIHLVLHTTHNYCDILVYYFYLVKGHNSSKTKWNVTTQ